MLFILPSLAISLAILFLFHPILSTPLDSQTIFQNVDSVDQPHHHHSHLSEWCAESKKAFLKAFKEGGVNEWVVVMGNEAADTDSMVSSLALAYHLAHRKKDPQKAVALLQIDAKAIPYRPENTLALKLARMQSLHEDLLTLDQLPWHRGKVAQMVKGIALTDHNRPLSYWAGAPLLAIIDHHEDRGVNTTASPRIIEPVGSASSLVGKLVLQEPHKRDVPIGLADLLLSAIAIDTKGLKKSKTTKTDRKTAEALFGRSSHKSSSLKKAMKKLADDMKRAQSDLGNLTNKEMYSRDYKGDLMYNSTLPLNLGFANIPESLDDMIKRSANGTIEGYFHESREWVVENAVDVLIVMTKSKEKSKETNEKIRELVLVAKHGQNLSEDQAERVFHTIRDHIAIDKELQVRPFRDESEWGHQRFAWRQTGEGVGRKTIRPIVEKVIQEW